jgi:outer membrane protein assembly factor BamA
MAGYLRANTGPGKDKSTLTVERLFTPTEVPGLIQQPDYSLFGAFADFDSRDSTSDPRAGGFYQARWTSFDDRDFDRFSFRRYELELQHFFPTHGKRGTVATRGLVSLIDTSPGQEVPFFMQQAVGGSNSLRGYRQDRFRDKNLLLFNLEYRWEVMELFDLVAFGDGGRVFSRRSDIGLDDMRGSVGLGGRVKFRERVWLGLDVGYSTEGVRIWLRGSNIF